MKSFRLVMVLVTSTKSSIGKKKSHVTAKYLTNKANNDYICQI